MHHFITEPTQLQLSFEMEKRQRNEGFLKFGGFSFQSEQWKVVPFKNLIRSVIWTKVLLKHKFKYKLSFFFNDQNVTFYKIQERLTRVTL